MKHIGLVILVVFIVAGAWYGLRAYLPGAVDKDFAAICRAYDVGMAKIQEAESNSQQPNEPEIAVGIANAVEETVIRKDVHNIVRAISVSAFESKYELLQQGASELGLKQWECESARRYFERHSAAP